LGYFAAEHESEPAPSKGAVAAAPTAMPPSGANWDQALRWRDDALNYEGRLRWTGSSPMAALDTTARDASTGAVVAQGSCTLNVMQDAPGRMVFSTQVQIPRGDSRTPGAHSHSVNLVFEQQGSGAWSFVKNCMAPGRPDLCCP